MSDVTNVLLAHDVVDADPGRLDEINSWLTTNLGQTLVEVADECVGGSKRLESILYAAAFDVASFNGHFEEEFVSFLRDLPWKMRRSVQLFVQGQEDVRFRCVDVYRPDETNEDLFDA